MLLLGSLASRLTSEYDRPMPLQAGAQLGHYEILAPLGAGGMGEVYRARDIRLGREVAIKVLSENLANSPEHLARLRQEARTVASLNHPNIVTLYSVEEHEGTAFLTMELIHGQSFESLIRDDALTPDLVLDSAIALADALVAAHGQGVVHRDLKPANLMLSQDGRLKVLDFGLAKLDQADLALDKGQAATMVSPVSRPGQILGTAPYMAPEQIRGETVDARADLFAFGIILYELISGRRPFTGKNFADLSSSILRDEPAELRAIRSNVPPALASIVARCLRKDREHRWQTAKELRRDLQMVSTEGSPSVAGEVSIAPSAPQPPPNSLAILPFENRSSAKDDEYFSDGLADELLSVLAKIRGIRVAARTSSGTFKGRSVTVAEVGRALDVANVLEGSVRRSGDRVRIAVQLVAVESGCPTWSETYERTLEDIFAVQDEIAQQVVRALTISLLGTDAAVSSGVRAAVAVAVVGRGENAEAHRLYLQGKHLAERLNAEDTARGIELIEQSLALDALQAWAWVELSRCFAMQAAYGWRPTTDAYRSSRNAVDQALALAPDLAEAHVMLSRLEREHHWNWQGAQSASRKALELAPGSVDALAEAGALAGNLGRFDEAADFILRAIELDPLRATNFSRLGYVYRALGKLVDAEAAAGKALSLHPQSIVIQHFLAVVLADQGRDAEALLCAEREPADWARLTALAYLHNAAGRSDASDQALAALEGQYSDKAAFQIAFVHSSRGEVDAAFAWLDRGVCLRDAGLAQAMFEPTFRPLHGDPRWAELLRTMNL